MTLHNFNLTARFLCEHCFGMPFCRVYGMSLLLSSRGGWQQALHFDLKLCLSKGLADIPRSFSQWKKTTEKRPPPFRLVVPPPTPCFWPPPRGGMQVRSSPTTPGPSQATIFHVYLTGLFLAIQSGFRSHVCVWGLSVMDSYLINLQHSCV